MKTILFTGLAWTDRNPYAVGLAMIIFGLTAGYLAAA